MNLSERMETKQVLATNYGVLDNQLKLLNALRDASGQLYSHDEWGTRADKLLVLVAREVVKTVAVIWEQSLKLQGREGELDESTREGRDETLPW